MSDARIAGTGRQRAIAAVIGSAALAGIPWVLAGCTTAQPDAAQSAMPSFAPLVQRVLPAVVNVSAVQHPQKAAAAGDGTAAGVHRTAARADEPAASLDRLLRRFFDERRGGREPDEGSGLALGSGFIIDPRGYIVTDDHVLENAEAVTVTFHDASEHPARIVGRDAPTDLALLKIDTPYPLPYLHWGDSDRARVGDWVLAVGNPFGLDDTVSSGIISARGRDIHSGPYDDFLQIDASINRGNSGGPTFNLKGDVIGINTAIYSPNGGSVGIGFAIPANLARPVVEQLEQRGRVERGWLGVQIQAVTPQIAESFGLAKAAGALVTAVSPDGPAARAGFEQGDVILSVNRREIGRMRDLPLIVAEMPVGQRAAVTVWRRDREVTLEPLIGAMPPGPRIAELGPDETAGLTAPRDLAAALRLAPLTRQWRRRLGLGGEIGGVVVTGIDDESPFAGLDLAPGDVIQSIDRQPVASPGDARAKLSRAAAGGGATVLLLINRRGSSRFLALALAGRTAGKSG